ncbi:conserved Plasmodium protein, unknown function [Plasmodium chabaudi chabaudi]|uniref:Oocyst capsule protein n=1 Tax=Plasmodium chabaudi chabaudi TaxID=31271 RepID=A0A4V0K6P2_PLACU|nr:conserved Plasmodium protein, unknown function [Plasmodium chabaudi chabaudi]VTZ68175.1 conserved Plasmodium protein, unknown function [Plasmodium chabaudi chabaudi]|eukprot:XP_016653686.1 conserved Plasmodium protein, unknown function [Plasmodium chabaudi chabaudi]
MNKRKGKVWLFLFIIFLIVILNDLKTSYEKQNERNLSELTKDEVKYEGCKQLIPFYLNTPEYYNISNEINISNDYSIKLDRTYIYFEYINRDFYVNLKLYSKHVDKVELYEYVDNKGVLLFDKNGEDNLIKYLFYVQRDKNNKYENEKKRIFYFIIHSNKIETLSECVDIRLDLGIGPVVLKSVEKKNLVGSVYNEEKVKKDKKIEHHNGYIIVKENYRYAPNGYFNFSLKNNKDLNIDENGKKYVIVYNVIIILEFNQENNIKFFSLLSQEKNKWNNFSMQLKKIKLNKNYLHNMNMEYIIKHANSDMNCDDMCVKSEEGKNEVIFLNALLSNNYIYNFQIRYAENGMENDKQVGKTTDPTKGIPDQSSVINFNFEYNIVNNFDTYTMLDYLRAHFNHENIQNTFFFDKIIQIKDDNINKNNILPIIGLNKECVEGNKKECNKYQVDNNYIIYGNTIEINDDFILNFDPNNLFKEEEKVSIIIEEESFFNFILESKSENILVNLLKKDSTDTVCNTYYLNHMKDYSLFSYLTKNEKIFLKYDKTNSSRHSIKNLSKKIIIYIKCIISKGEYDLKINFEGYNKSFETNNINLIIQPLRVYENVHSCDSKMNTITDMFYYNLRTESSHKKNDNSVVSYKNIYEKMWELNNPIFNDFDFIILYENEIFEKVDKIIVTINNSIFSDIFIIILETIKDDTHYYVYKNSREVTEYEIQNKFNNKISIYVLTPSLHYSGKKICGFFFVDIDFIQSENKKEFIGEVSSFNMHEANKSHIGKVNHIPYLIIGYDTYSFSQFCYIPDNKEHVLLIFIEKESIIKINCFMENYVYIELYERKHVGGEIKKVKLFEEYQQAYIESFTKGEYEIVFKFNVQNDREMSNFFYLQIYIYQISLLDKCVFPIEDNFSEITEGSNSIYDLNSVAKKIKNNNNNNNNKEIGYFNDKNGFIFENDSSYYFFKRYLLFLFPKEADKKIEKKIILPAMDNMNDSGFVLKAELVFHKNFLPYKLSLQESGENMLTHESNIYKNKVIITLNILNKNIKFVKLYIYLYDNVHENINEKYCPYAYLNIIYARELERYNKTENEEYQYGTMNLPLLLNNILLKKYADSEVAKVGEVREIREVGSVENEKSTSDGDKNRGELTPFHENNRVSINNQRIEYKFVTSNNNMMFFLAEKDVFLNMYIYKDGIEGKEGNGNIVLSIYKYKDASKFEKSEILPYDEINKDIESCCEKVGSYAKTNDIYISTYFEKGLYIFKYSESVAYINMVMSMMWVEAPNVSGVVDTSKKNNKYEINSYIEEHESKLYFSKELKCSEKKEIFYEDKNLKDFEKFFIQNVFDKNLYTVYYGTKKNEITFSNQSKNIVIYERVHICFGNEIFNNKIINNSGNIEENEKEESHIILNLNVEKECQLYVEIKPHFYYFIYPFEINILSKGSYFKVSSEYKNYVYANVEQGEYKIEVSFKIKNDAKNEVSKIRGAIFDVIVFINNISNENKLKNANLLDKENKNMVSLKSETYNMNKLYTRNIYKNIFNKVNLKNLDENGIVVNENIITHKYEYNHFFCYDKYIIKNNQEIFFTLMDNVPYILKVYLVPIYELSGNNNLEKAEKDGKNGDPSILYNPSNNYLDYTLNVRNVFNIEMVENNMNNSYAPEKVIKEKRLKNKITEKKTSDSNILYANEDNEYILNVYEVSKNFKLVIKNYNNIENNENHVELILSLVPLKYYKMNANQKYSNEYIGGYFKNIFNTISGKTNLYSGIIFEKQENSTHLYTRVETSVVYLKNIIMEESFSFPLHVKKGSYIKLNIGYDFSRVNFDVKIMRNNKKVSSSNKIRGNMDDGNLNIFENISLFLEEGDYTFQIIFYNLIDNYIHINKNMSFPFYFSFETFEFAENKNDTSVLLDVYPHNSVHINKAYPFNIDLIFWSDGSKEKHPFMEDGMKKAAHLRVGEIIRSGKIEIHKNYLLPEDMNNLKNNMVLKFGLKDNVYIINENDNKKNKYLFTFLNNDIKQNSKQNEVAIEMSHTEHNNQEKLKQIHSESTNKSILLEYKKEDVGKVEEKGSSISHNASQDKFYDIDEAIKNYRSRKNEDSKESTSSIFSKPFSEPDNKSCIYIPIFLIEIYCFEKNNLLYFIFILFIFFMTSAFIFLLIKFYKNWKYYRNYDIFKEYDETVSLFDDDI